MLDAVHDSVRALKTIKTSTRQKSKVLYILYLLVNNVCPVKFQTSLMLQKLAILN